MTADLRRLVRSAADRLGENGALSDAYIIAEKVFSLTKTQLLTDPVREIDEALIKKFDFCINKLSTGYPLQYIIEEWDFASLTFYVCEGVLIPRCETEQIVDRACEYLSECGARSPLVLDVCCGSGCIGLSIAARFGGARVCLLDCSETALGCTRENIRRLGTKNARAVRCDIFEGFPAFLEDADVMVCNPPYVTEEEYASLDKNIYYEPKQAIVAPGDGLEFYRCFAAEWLPHLKKGGFFMLEGSEWQGERIKEIINACGVNAHVQSDIFGARRFVCGIKN